MGQTSTCKLVSLCLTGALFMLIGILFGKNFIVKMVVKRLTASTCMDSISHSRFKRYDIKMSLSEGRCNCCKIVFLFAGGIILILLGALLGQVIIVKLGHDGAQDVNCLRPKKDSTYKKLVGDVSKRQENYIVKIFHWNLTNKDEFLYNGADPMFKEVGPYVYNFGSEKLNVQFTEETVKYQSAVQYEYNEKKTKQLCPNCSPQDKITTANLGYIGTTIATGGDKNLAYSLVPNVVSGLLHQAAEKHGNMSNVMKKIGKFNQMVLSEVFNFDFSTYLADVQKYNVSLINFTEVEMDALYNIITNSTLLGVAAPPPSHCTQSPASSDCLNTGFLNLANWLDDLQQKLVASGQNPYANQTFVTLLGTIGQLLCQNPSTTCILVANYPSMINWITYYVIEYLASAAMNMVIDSPDYGVITTKTHTQIANGYYLTTLKLPGYPNGVLVPGLLGNDTDLEEAKRTKKYQEFYLCGVSSQREFAWAKFDGKEYNPAEYFKNPAKEFLKISGRYTNSYFGSNEDLKVCKSVQSSTRESYMVYDNTMKSSFTIRKKEESSYKDVPVYMYETDMDELYGVNNVSVFTEGLLDLSATRNGMPFFLSAPHFYKGDKNLSQQLKMKPDKEKHKTTYYIEPVSGATLNMIRRRQINTLILDNMVEAPRLRKYALTYKEKDASKPTKPFPVVWAEYHVYATDEDVEKFPMLFNAFKAGCAAIVIGPIIGILFIAFAFYLYYKRVKHAAAVNDSHRKSSSSL